MFMACFWHGFWQTGTLFLYSYLRTGLFVHPLSKQVLSARSLPAADANGFSDPYAVLELVDADSGKPLKPPRKHRTKTVHKTLNPQWNEAFTWKDLEEDVGSLLVKV
jgi:Ca2+-dependent lipid-binding protein